MIEITIVCVILFSEAKSYPWRNLLSRISFRRYKIECRNTTILLEINTQNEEKIEQKSQNGKYDKDQIQKSNLLLQIKETTRKTQGHAIQFIKAIEMRLIIICIHIQL